MSSLRSVARKCYYKCLAMLSLPIKKTDWYKGLFVDYYHNRYPDIEWFRHHDERNFDVVNLGSSSSKWAFDYSGIDIRAMNWANQPQTLVVDYKLFKNFHSILRKGGVVIIAICPLSSIGKQPQLGDVFRYQGTLSWELLDPRFRDQAVKLREYPILFRRQAVNAVIRYLLKGERDLKMPQGSMSTDNPLSDAELDLDAKSWVNGWAKEFNINDFEAPINQDNMKRRAVRVGVMRDLVDFIMERGYCPVLVLPPVTRHLGKFLTPKFREVYIDSFLRDVGRNVRLLDYMNNSEFQDDNLYFNSFFLNAKGRQLFTKRVLKDLQLI